MDVLFNYILAAMILWSPPTMHAFYESAAQTNLRYQSIAKVIVDGVNDPQVVLPFTDDKVKSALLMTSIAATESNFNRDIDNCQWNGDHNTSFTIWQVQAPRSQVCGDRAKAFRKAVEYVNQSFNSCKSYLLIDRLAGYTSGACHANWGPSRLKMNKALNYLTSHPYHENP